MAGRERNLSADTPVDCSFYLVVSKAPVGNETCFTTFK